MNYSNEKIIIHNSKKNNIKTIRRKKRSLKEKLTENPMLLSCVQNCSNFVFVVDINQIIDVLATIVHRNFFY